MTAATAYTKAYLGGHPQVGQAVHQLRVDLLGHDVARDVRFRIILNPHSAKRLVGCNKARIISSKIFTKFSL